MALPLDMLLSVAWFPPPPARSPSGFKSENPACLEDKVF